jgi:hypothetical protein
MLQDIFDNYLKEEKKEKETDWTQINIEAEHYENSGPTPEEIDESEKMVKEDRKNELRRLVFNQHLNQETYYLMNKLWKKNK